jgi:TetR/AcrR family transcriptional regulator of autoinduction and epiphytic fitness
LQYYGGAMQPPKDSIADGRTARRERSRIAVVDAAFELILDGKVPPAPADIAERAGVSVSSVFRNFDGLGDIQHQAIERFDERFAHLLLVAPQPDTPLATRIERFVSARVELYQVAGPVIRLARQRSLDYPAIADSVGKQQSRLADQTRNFFAPETAASTPARASNFLALIDALTSPAAFDVMSGAHARTPRQISQTWAAGITTLLHAHTTTHPTGDIT